MAKLSSKLYKSLLVTDLNEDWDAVKWTPQLATSTLSVKSRGGVENELVRCNRDDRSEIEALAVVAMNLCQTLLHQLDARKLSVVHKSLEFYRGEANEIR